MLFRSILYGELPNQSQLAEWVQTITHHTLIHENIKKFIEGFHHDAHPMGILISTIAALSAFYPNARSLVVGDNVLGKAPIRFFLAREDSVAPLQPWARAIYALRQPVDVRNDLLRHQARRVRDARQHEGVLHIHDDQCGFRGVEILMDMLAAVSLDDTVHDRLRDSQFVHRNPPENPNITVCCGRAD